MSGIDWSRFTWEAFATLTTGILAVAAAVFIGRRQVAISNRQGEILARQVRLAELTLKHELFDRRMSVYQAVGRYLEQLATDAAPPKGEIHLEFFRAIALARFLFSADVNERLSEIRDKAWELLRLANTMRASLERKEAYKEGTIERESELVGWFFERWNSMHDIFGTEISLVEP